MKKNTIETLVSYLTANGELPEVRAELEAELAKGKAKADANRAVYEELHDRVFEVLGQSNTPLTANDIAQELSESRNKISWGLNNYWTDEVVVDDSGKVKTYRLP